MPTKGGGKATTVKLASSKPKGCTNVKTAKIAAAKKRAKQLFQNSPPDNSDSENAPMVVQLQKELAELKKKMESKCMYMHTCIYILYYTVCTSPVHCLFTSTEVFKVATPSAHKFPRNVHGQFPKLVKHLFTGGEQSWISLSTPVYFAVIVHWDSSVDCAILYKDACAPEYIMLLL